jgi:hypothetical protein
MHQLNTLQLLEPSSQGVKYHEWRSVSSDEVWVNHAFRKSMPFNTLCGKHFGATNGANARESKCSRCGDLVEDAEKAAVARAAARVLRDEPKRLKRLQEVALAAAPLSLRALNRLLDIIRKEEGPKLRT